jgi:preprotein translocase subunit YajC
MFMHLTAKFCRKPHRKSSSQWREKMDTRTLVVGQKIWMKSGDELIEGKVSEITEKYVEVEVPKSDGGKYAVRFDKNGEQPDFYDPNVRDMNAHIRDWDFGIFRFADGWSPLRLCGENGEPYALTLTPAKHCDQ